jgi:sulfite reductase (NADPH) flavoprotein alpha-component
MAGLGTGAAPFRAFLQHRAWLAQQQTPVGPTYYYFGSRHQSQEYLYGEELEAFIADGMITRAGLAFSRDGPRKVYIQHKMAEDERELADMLYDDKGAFYLCGPTWPVPDVYEALVGALVKFKGLEPEAAGAFLEGLKEEERYVLEVRESCRFIHLIPSLCVVATTTGVLERMNPAKYIICRLPLVYCRSRC